MSQTATRERRAEAFPIASLVDSSYGTCHVSCGCGYVALDMPERHIAESVARRHCVTTGHAFEGSARF
jgi:hypothetical protein